MPKAATTDATASPSAPRALQQDGRALTRLAANAAADVAHIGLPSSTGVALQCLQGQHAPAAGG